MLAVAAERAVGVGDPENGDIFLPPARLWGAARSGSSSTGRFLERQDCSP